MKIAVLDWKTMTMNGDIVPSEIGKLGSVKLFGLTEPDSVIANIGDAEAVLCNKVQITREVIDNCPNMKYIGLFATGYNNVDVKYAAEKGIAVCNAGQYSTNAVAQQVFAYILDHYSCIRRYDAAVKNGEWETSEIFSYFPFSTHELNGKVLSIIGFGSIGRAVAKIGDAFGMKIIVSTRTKPSECEYELADIRTAAEKADILTLHCPLNEQTQGLICSELISSMKNTAVIINTSRGGTVIESELAEALNRELIAAAYLDVLDKEPMISSTPLKTAKNCIITPHTSWAPLETRERLLAIVCDNLKAWQNGNPQNKVN